MLLTKFSNLPVIHTAGTNLTVSDMLSRDFSHITKEMSQLQHKTLPPHIELMQLKPNIALNQIQYPVKHEDGLPTLKSDSHPILVDYGDYKFTLRFIIQDMAHRCSLFKINHSSRTPYSFWTNGLVEVQNRNLGSHLRFNLPIPPTNWSFQTQMYAYAHNTTPLSQLKRSPHQTVFHKHPRIPLTFSINLNCDSSKTCVATNFNSLHPYTHYCDQDRNPFFHSLLNNSISLGLLPAEHAMLKLFSTVHRHVTIK